MAGKLTTWPWPAWFFFTKQANVIGVLTGVSEIYSKILRVRLRPDQYSAMALQAAAEGHTSISNWARAHLVGLLVKPDGSVQATVADETPTEPGQKQPTSTMEAVHNVVRSTASSKPSKGVSLFTDNELKAILDEALQDED